MTTYTPAMQQYIDIKKQNPDCILFFRIGDFYETFWEDAKICSKVLDILLTSKNKGSESPIPLAGIPYHSIDKYIPKLINHGYKVAIAEQTTDPAPGKIVEREVVSIITPGTYIQEQKKDYTYTLGLFFLPAKDGYNYHIAWGDFSLGHYQTKSFVDIADMQKFILTIKPVEIILDVDFTDKDSICTPLLQYMKCSISVYELPANPDVFITSLTHTQSIASYGKALESGRLEALALLLYYLKHTQKAQLTNIVRIGLHSQEQRVLLDDITIKNLELFSSSYEGSEKYSLIGILDTTKTSGGARLLRNILSNPVNDLAQLQRRLGHIDRYLTSLDTFGATSPHHIHHVLGQVIDIPKVISSLLYKKISPSYFARLRSTLALFLEDKATNPYLTELRGLGLKEDSIQIIFDIYVYLKQILKSNEEIKEDMDFICDGYNKRIDELRTIAYHSDDLLLKYQQQLVDITGINNVKLKFVINQGYFIEITNKDITQFETKLKDYLAQTTDQDLLDTFHLIRRNTLKGGQRYVSAKLDHLQEDILLSKDELRRLEFQLLEETKRRIADVADDLTTFAETISWLDVFVAYALLAKEKGYIKPIISHQLGITIIGGRHPVIEEYLPQDQQFIPNNLEIVENTDFLHIITGPNMGGKSTYLRQNALIVLMAHCGLFVPAQEANIGLVDALFARVGSGDVIAKNQSTFMTEMIEVANILNNATPKSFIIFDELGRGTSTYDGLALTTSILEYIAAEIKAKTLIATHYHELIALELQLPGVKNFSVTVYETDKEVVFMKKIAAGGASKSYGLDVAKIAGIAQPILERAKQHLFDLEKQKKEHHNTSTELFSPSSFSATDPRYDKIKSLLESFDINTMTPLQALQLLSKIKEDI